MAGGVETLQSQQVQLGIWVVSDLMNNLGDDGLEKKLVSALQQQSGKRVILQRWIAGFIGAASHGHRRDRSQRRRGAHHLCRGVVSREVMHPRRGQVVLIVLRQRVDVVLVGGQSSIDT